MTQELWSAVDRYICDHLLDEDAALDAALAASDAAGLPSISVTPNQGRLLELLVRIHGARRVLELGTLGGYSTIWLARGLPSDGRLVTLEANPRFAEVALTNIAAAGLAEVVQLRVGPALETLPELAAEGALAEGAPADRTLPEAATAGAPFDLIFIDADKQNYPGYLEWSLKLSRPGTLIVADNVVRGGAILDADSGGEEPEDHLLRGVRSLYELLAERIGGQLTPEQTNALQVITGPERAAVLVGPAGPGKGVVIDAAARAEQHTGHHTLGIAISGSTAQRLGYDSPALAGQTLTLDALLARVDHGKLGVDAATIYFDEAGMADTNRLARLTETIERTGAKLIVIGDAAQLPSIGAGGMFDRLTHIAPTAELSHIRRTLDPAEQKHGPTCAPDDQTARWRTTTLADNSTSPTPEMKRSSRPPRHGRRSQNTMIPVRSRSSATRQTKRSTVSTHAPSTSARSAANSATSRPRSPESTMACVPAIG
jgi:predicted O-methyltransferase YrrM